MESDTKQSSEAAILQSIDYLNGLPTFDDSEAHPSFGQPSDLVTGSIAHAEPADESEDETDDELLTSVNKKKSPVQG
ncbi:hypothetical protein LTR66_017949, partial [Elasticomyces elasticus]